MTLRMNNQATSTIISLVFLLTIVIFSDAFLLLSQRLTKSSSPQRLLFPVLSTPRRNNIVHHVTATTTDVISSSMMEHTVELFKPMGIILEEVDLNDPLAGVMIQRIDPNGQTAQACRSGNNDIDICIGDLILAVNGQSCRNLPFEDVMDRIIATETDTVVLTLGRPDDTVVVQWPNGVSIGSKAGTCLGEVADDAEWYEISYSCRSGGCGTCEQMITENGGSRTRYVRPCVARVPSQTETIRILTQNDIEHLSP